MAPVLRVSANADADRLIAVVHPAAGRSVTAVLRQDGCSIEKIEPGMTTVELRLPSGKSLTREVDVAPDGVTECQFDLRDAGHEWLAWQRVYSAKWKPPSTLERAGPNWLEAVSAYRLCYVRAGVMTEQPLERRVGLPADAEMTPVYSINSDEERWSAVLHEHPHSRSEEGRPGVTVELTDPRTSKRTKIAIMLPLPWTTRRYALVDVQVVVQSRSGRAGGLETDVVIQDPAVASVLSYVASGDLASARALEEDLLRVAREMLYGKLANPLAAAAGAYALLRLGFSELAWTRNLWKLFSWLPDGAIVHAAHLLRNYKPEYLTDIRDALLDAARLGAPVFTDGVRLLQEGLIQVQSSKRYADDPVVAKALTYASALASATQPNQICTTITAEPDALQGLLCGAFQDENR